MNSKPTTGNGSILVTRAGSSTEQRKIRIVYGGRSIVFLLLIAASITLILLNKDNWALLALALEVVHTGNTMLKYRRDLEWVTGYDKTGNH
jgi:hypothetical protein